MSYDERLASHFRYLAIMERRLWRIKKIASTYAMATPNGGNAKLMRLCDVAIRATQGDLDEAHRVVL